MRTEIGNDFLLTFTADNSERNMYQNELLCRCGNADRHILSVYCLKGECQSNDIRDAPICGTRLPHDSHGCIDGSLIDWRKAHNV